MQSTTTDRVYIDLVEENRANNLHQLLPEQRSRYLALTRYYSAFMPPNIFGDMPPLIEFENHPSSHYVNGQRIHNFVKQQCAIKVKPCLSVPSKNYNIEEKELAAIMKQF